MNTNYAVRCQQEGCYKWCSEKVAQYSMKKHGNYFCWVHQRLLDLQKENAYLKENATEELPALPLDEDIYKEELDFENDLMGMAQHYD